MWEIWRFVAPALNQNERRYAIPFIIAVVVLFAARLRRGVVHGRARRSSSCSSDRSAATIQPFITADKYLTLVMLMFIAFGVAFEFPVLLVFLLLVGVVNTRQLRHSRRWAIVGIVVFAAVITPSQDPFSLLFMAVPDVHLLRDVDHDRAGAEAMSPVSHDAGRCTATGAGASSGSAIGGAVAVVLGTALLVWLLRPGTAGVAGHRRSGQPPARAPRGSSASTLAAGIAFCWYVWRHPRRWHAAVRRRARRWLSSRSCCSRWSPASLAGRPAPRIPSRCPPSTARDLAPTIAATRPRRPPIPGETPCRGRPRARGYGHDRARDADHHAAP